MCADSESRYVLVRSIRRTFQPIRGKKYISVWCFQLTVWNYFISIWIWFPIIYFLFTTKFINQQNPIYRHNILDIIFCMAFSLSIDKDGFKNSTHLNALKLVSLDHRIIHCPIKLLRRLKFNMSFRFIKARYLITSNLSNYLIFSFVMYAGGFYFQKRASYDTYRSIMKKYYKFV